MNYLMEEPYKTPPGCIDFPYAYVLNASGFTDGQNQENVQVQIQGDSDFILRNIVGVDTVVNSGASGGKFNFKNASGSYAYSAQLVVGPGMTVVPEKLYPRNSQIYMDFYNVLRSSTSNAGSTIYNSYVGLFGVKRFNRDQGYRSNLTPYKYRERRYSYEQPITLTQGRYTQAGGTVVTPASRFVVQLDNYDFELLQVGISNSTGTGGLATNDFQIQLYDPNMHQLSSAPLNQGFVNSAREAANQASVYQGVMPVPSLVWPAGGNIVFDVTSFLPNADVPQTYNVSFEGIWRIPCR